MGDPHGNRRNANYLKGVEPIERATIFHDLPGHVSPGHISHFDRIYGDVPALTLSAWRIRGELELGDRGRRGRFSGMRSPEAEAECLDLLRLLGHGRHGLQWMHEHLSLASCKNHHAQDHRSPRHQEQARPAGAHLKVDKYN
jgi:hypothetical protein